MQPRFFLARMNGPLNKVTDKVAQAKAARAAEQETVEGMAEVDPDAFRLAVGLTPPYRRPAKASAASPFSGRRHGGPVMFSGRRYGGLTTERKLARAH